jgi:hypothetical protein
MPLHASVDILMKFPFLRVRQCIRLAAGVTLFSGLVSGQTVPPEPATEPDPNAPTEVLPPGTLAPPGAPATPEPPAPALSPEDARVLAQLEKIAEAVTKSRSSNNFAAVDAIREAAGAEAKALELWLDSVREADFRAKDRKDAEWRQWRDGAGRRLNQPGTGKALQLHFQYLLLTIKAAGATKEPDRIEVLGNLVSFLDDLARNGKDVIANRQVLDQSVLSTAVARRFKLDSTVKVEGAWVMTPAAIGSIYDTVILPFYREKKDAAKLQSMWNRRMQQEAALVAAAESDFDKKFFREVTQPRLEWGLARDLFIAGNRESANKLLMIISQNPGHKDAPQWVQDLRALITAPPESLDALAATTTPPPEPPESTPGASTGGAPPGPALDNRPPPRETSGRRREGRIFPPNLGPGR